MIEELSELSGAIPNAPVRDWKSQGKKVIGFRCAYVPEEVEHAAGMLPFWIRGTGCTQTNRSDTVLSGCSGSPIPIMPSIWIPKVARVAMNAWEFVFGVQYVLPNVDKVFLTFRGEGEISL